MIRMGLAERRRVAIANPVDDPMLLVRPAGKVYFETRKHPSGILLINALTVDR